MRKKRLTAAIIFVAVLVVFIVFVTALVTPKRSDYGCLWKQFGEEDKNSLDVMYFGSSISYCDIIPARIYSETGMTSFVMAGPVLSMAETYYYVREALKTQSPQLVMVEVSALFFENIENYDLVNVGYMPFGENKLGAMISSMPASQWVNVLFPLYAYHNRWNSLEKNDFERVLKGYEPDTLAGYTLLTKAEAYPDVTLKDEVTDSEKIDTAADYLRKITELCNEGGINLVLYLSPRRNYHSEQNTAYLMNLVTDLQAEFIDFDTAATEMGIDPQTDYYDRSHLNYSGACKFSDYLGEYLSALVTHNAEEDSVLWQERINVLP